MTKEQVISAIARTGIVPVVRAASPDEARRAIDALCEGGIDTVEVTLTVPGAFELIADLAAAAADVLIGAGTVLTADDAHRSIDAGARFVVSPATSFEVIEYCRARSVVVIPGTLTPTEIVTALAAGADAVKVFPVGAMGGADYIRSLRAPLPDVKVMATGGVTVETAGEYLRAGAFAVGLGSDLVDLNAIRSGSPQKLTETARRALGLAAEARSQNV